LAAGFLRFSINVIRNLNDLQEDEPAGIQASGTDVQFGIEIVQIS
jgi:hypothetical protein